MGGDKVPGPSATKCLYYPYIHFQSLDWLKAALLYWEGVKRIIPADHFPTQDAPEVRMLLQEKVVENVSAEEARVQAADLFIPKIAHLVASRGGNIRDGMRRTAELASRDRDDTGLVHGWKMTKRVISQLEESGLARQSGNWYAMGQEIAGLYMTVLAGELARRHNCPMVTDEFDLEVASLYFNTNDGTEEAAPDSLAFVRMMCPVFRPANLKGVSVDRVLTMRAKYGPERRRFREVVQSMATSLSKATSVVSLRDALEDKKREIGEALGRQRELLDELRVNAASTMMSIAVPTALTAALAAAGLPPLSITLFGGTALAVSAIDWYGKLRGAQRARREASPWHYLLTLEKKVVPAQPDAGFADRMRKFIYE